MHIFHRLLQKALASPESHFCEFVARGVSRAVTVREICLRSWGFAEALHAVGVPPGGIVVIVLEHDIDLYAAFIGATLIGAIPSFLPPLTRKQDPQIHRDQMGALFSRTEPAAVITSFASNKALGWAGSILFKENVATAEVLRPAPTTAPTVVALLQHSSGTTGLKKGVQLTHGQVVRHAEQYSHSIGLCRSGTVVSWLPLYHDMGLLTAFLIPVLTGNSIVSLDALEWVMRPSLLLEHLDGKSASFCWLPNFAFNHTIRMDRGDRLYELSGVRALIDCSEPCRMDTLEAFAAKYAFHGLKRGSLGACYAMAEAVFAITQTPAGHFPVPSRYPEAAGIASSGSAISGCSIDVRSHDGLPARDGQVGEIWVRSENLFAGYHRQPELAASRLEATWLRTGDLGVLEKGELFVIGRVDDMININGRNVMAHEIEDFLSKEAGVAPGRVLVYAEADPLVGSDRLLVVVEAAHSEQMLPELEGRISLVVESLTGVTPSRIQVLERGVLIKSSSGKIARKASIRKILLRQGGNANAA